jgi:hypothetical protein
VALVDGGIVHNGHHGFQAAFRDVEYATHVVLDVVTGDQMGRESRSRSGNGGD